MATSAKLVFLRPASGDGKLVLGDKQGDGGGSIAPPASVSIDAAFEPDRAPALVLRAAAPLAIDAAFDDADTLPADVRLLWDANVSRGLRTRLQTLWQDARATAAAVHTRWQTARPTRRALAARWQTARRASASLHARWQDTQRLRSALRPHWQQATPARARQSVRWQAGQRLRASLATGWQQGQPARNAVRANWQDTIRLRAALRTHWQDATPARAALAIAFTDGQHLRITLRTHWQEAMRPPSGRYVPPPVTPPVPPPCYDPARLGLLVFEDLFSGSGKLLFICRRAGGGLPPAQIIIPTRRVYLVNNEVELIRVDGNLPLPAYTLALSLDADSWTWRWSATLDKSALALLAPAQAGVPVQVQASINRVPYRLLVESVRRARQFASTRIEVAGRGLAALLDAPYAPQMDFGNPDAQASAHQLMLDALTINSASIGWTVDFGLTDWIVPAAAWAHQGTWISAINTIAQAAGGYVQPHPLAQTLRVLPRYPQAPWDWSAITPDIQLPQAPVSIEGVEWIAKPDYNRVYVSGEGSGILADVVRHGTPGDIEAPMVVDPLITLYSPET